MNASKGKSRKVNSPEKKKKKICDDNIGQNMVKSF